MKRILIKLALCILSSSPLGAVQTINPGVLTVAVIEVVPEELPHHNSWAYAILTKYAREQGLDVDFVVVPFDRSWELPAKDLVDVSATGLAPLPERLQEGVSSSEIYCQVQRGLRIHAEDAGRFHTIFDFVGCRVATVRGMTAEIDLGQRAPEGVEIVRVDTWDKLYDLFLTYQVDAIAEGYYVLPGFEETNQLDPDHPMIDNHDLVPGEIEGNTFFVRDRSEGLLESLNAFIEENGLPYQRIH